VILNVALLYSVLLAPAPDSGLAIQAVVQTDFEFMASVRTTKSEFWIVSREQTYEKRGNQVRRVKPFASPPAEKDDIHTLGFDYEPDFRVLKVEDTAETRVLHGRTCQLTTAWAVADYAEARLRFWLCPRADERETELNAIVARAMSFRHLSLEREALKLLEARGGRSALASESEIEPAIAQRMKLTVRVLSLDAKPLEGNVTLPPEGGRDAR
jgi:hypothetical protein